MDSVIPETNLLAPSGDESNSVGIAEPMPARRPWSIAAIASVLCGIVLIVPYLAGAAAIGLGIIGLRQTAQTQFRGRRLAIAGAILGLLNIIGWTVYFRTVAVLSAPGRAIAHHFIDDLNSMKLDEARQQCLGSISPDTLQTLASQIQSWGGAKGVTILSVTTETDNGVVTGSVTGDIRTPTGEHVFELNTAGGKISEVTVQ